jgi:transposase
MIIIGCDFHPRFQQIAMVNDATGELQAHRLEQGNGEAEQFYRRLQGQTVRIGMEASGHCRWFERLIAELGFQLWIGDPAQIRAKATRKQKTDKRDAQLILELLLQDRFPRLRWWPTPAERDVRQLVLHRHRLVQMRTRVKNQLQALAMNECLCGKSKLWSRAGRAQFDAVSLLPWTARRRQDLFQLHDELVNTTAPLDQAVAKQAAARPEVRRLMTHPGVGEITALTFVLIVGDPRRFASSRKLTSYLGLIPSEDSSGGKQRLGHISKQGNALLRGLLTEAAQQASRRDPELRRCWGRLAMRKNKAIATVAVARKLAVRLWWMWIRGLDYGQQFGSGSHAG